MQEEEDPYQEALLSPSNKSGPSQSLKNDNGKGIKKGFVLSLLIAISLGTFQFGYSIGVFNTLQAPFAAKFDWITYKLNQV